MEHMRLLQNSHMQEVKLWCMHHAYTIAFLFMLCNFWGYSIGSVYGLTLLPDEFGYWSYAAAAAGYDWSDIVSLNSYYSYGYSVLLLPFFMLFQDGLTAYRAAVTMNFVMLAGIGLMLQYLAGKLFSGQFSGRFSDRKEPLPYACATAAALYPPLLLYAKTTMAETTLAFLFVLLLVLLYQYLEHGKFSSIFLMLVVLVYAHFVHMRAVALIVAGVLAFLVDKLFFRNTEKGTRHSRKKLNYVAAVAVAIVLFAVGMAVKDVILNQVFDGNLEHFQTNDYRGQLKKIQYIMTLEGLKNLMISVAGKLLYLGTATFGTAFWGIWHACKVVRKGKERKNRAFWLFVLLSASGSLMLSAVYTVRPGRVDALTYGRYHEYVFPILVAAGLYEMWHACRLWRGMFLTAGMELCMLVPILNSLHTYHQTSLHVCMIFGMSYLYDVGEQEPIRFFLMAYGFGVLLTIVVTALIAAGHKMGNWKTVLLLIAVMELLLAIRASAAVTDTGSIGVYRDSVVADKIVSLQEDLSDGENQAARKVLYLSRGDNSNIGRIQFLLRDTRITVLDRRDSIDDYDEDEMGIWDLVLTDYRDDYGREQLSKRYAYALSSGHFILYYN